MKNILVLVNLSAGAERMAKAALKTAQQTNSDLLLCNVHEVPVNSGFSNTAHGNLNFTYGGSPYITMEELAEKTQWSSYYETERGSYQPQVSYIPNDDFNTDKIKQLIVANDVKMIVTGVADVLDIGICGLLEVINKANRPVLVIPDNTTFKGLNITAYLTDLRYCDLEVVRFLKTFSARIYVTHLSSSGIPDLEDQYAQNLLSDTIAAKVSYNKLFLRNIKGTNRKRDLETITKNERIDFFTIVNHKHNLLERFLSDTALTKRLYHNLPLLIMP